MGHGGHGSIQKVHMLFARVYRRHDAFLQDASGTRKRTDGDIHA